MLHFRSNKSYIHYLSFQRLRSRWPFINKWSTQQLLKECILYEKRDEEMIPSPPTWQKTIVLMGFDSNKQFSIMYHTTFTYVHMLLTFTSHQTQTTIERTKTKSMLAFLERGREEFIGVKGAYSLFNCFHFRVMPPKISYVMEDKGKNIEYLFFTKTW